MRLWILSATKAQDIGTLSGLNLHQIISGGSRFKHLSFQAASDWSLIKTLSSCQNPELLCCILELVFFIIHYLLLCSDRKHISHLKLSISRALLIHRYSGSKSSGWSGQPIHIIYIRELWRNNSIIFSGRLCFCGTIQPPEWRSSSIASVLVWSLCSSHRLTSEKPVTCKRCHDNSGFDELFLLKHILLSTIYL